MESTFCDGSLPYPPAGERRRNPDGTTRKIGGTDMTSSLFTELMKAVAILGVFLLIGAFLRAKAPFFRKLLLPAL